MTMDREHVIRLQYLHRKKSYRRWSWEHRRRFVLNIGGKMITDEGSVLLHFPGPAFSGPSFSAHVADNICATGCQISLLLASNVRHYLMPAATIMHTGNELPRRQARLFARRWRRSLSSLRQVALALGERLPTVKIPTDNIAVASHPDSTIVLHRLPAGRIRRRRIYRAIISYGCCGCRRRMRTCDARSL